MTLTIREEAPAAGDLSWPCMPLHGLAWPSMAFHDALPSTPPQPSPPDLALVEFGINTNARDLPMFELLLTTLRSAGHVAGDTCQVPRGG